MKFEKILDSAWMEYKNWQFNWNSHDVPHRDMISF